MKNCIIKKISIFSMLIILIFTTGCVNNDKQIEETTSDTTPVVSQTQETTMSEETTETTTEETSAQETSQSSETTETTIETTTQEQTTVATTQATTQETTTEEQTTITTTTQPPQTEPEEEMHSYDLSQICVKNPFSSANLPDRVTTVEDVVDLRVYAQNTGKSEIETYISTFDENVLEHIYLDALINEVQIQYIDTEHIAKFLITYSEEYKIYQAIKNKNTSYLTSKELKVYNKVYEIINSVVDINDSDYNNAKALHDYIINTTRYAHIDDDNTSYGALINGKAVCSGYSEAYWLLCNASGIPCRNISGSASGENHQWNIIYVNGEWLYTDVTWDDPISNSGDILTYDNFAKSQNLNNHTFDSVDLRL